MNLHCLNCAWISFPNARSLREPMTHVRMTGHTVVGGPDADGTTIRITPDAP